MDSTETCPVRAGSGGGICTWEGKLVTERAPRHRTAAEGREGERGTGLLQCIYPGPGAPRGLCVEVIGLLCQTGN